MISLKMLLVARKRFGHRQTTITSTLTMRGPGRLRKILQKARGTLGRYAMLPFRRPRRLRWLT